jgi:hypothetical protein
VGRLRPEGSRPRKVVGVCSERSRAVCGESGFYDECVLYGDVEGAKKKIVDDEETKHVVLLDFGARERYRETWNEALSSLPSDRSDIRYTFVTVGGEVKVQGPEEAAETLAQFQSGVLVNASELRERGIETGGDKYFEEFYGAFEDFKKAGGIPGMRLEWGEGMEAWAEGWEKLCKDEVPANVGLVYRI